MKWLLLDRSLSFTLAARIWQGLAGPVTLVFLISSLTLPEQGFYYGILGILGFHAFFELGLAQVLVSQSSHAAAHLDSSEVDDSEIRESQLRMALLIKTSAYWFSFSAILFAVVAIAFGWQTFAMKQSDVQWQSPFLFAVLATAVSLGLTPFSAILEGAGYREMIYRLRFFQVLTGNVVVWLLLLSGGKLWATFAAWAVQAVWTGVIVWQGREFLNRFRGVAGQPTNYSWSNDVLPMQWRMAVLSVVYHLATQLFPVIVIRFHSEEEAAPLGMTGTVIMAIQLLAYAWAQTKYPLIANLHASGNREQAGSLWRHTALVSCLIQLLALVGFFVAVVFINAYFPSIKDRFVTPLQLVAYSAGCVAMHLISLQALYVLSRRTNPLFVPSIIGYVVTTALVWYGGYAYSINGVLTGFAIGTVLILLPLHTWAYLKFRQRTLAHESPHEASE
ncbi:hypothetical protein V22_05120 [Calycomorphotria hydatis]|uniref:Polysaccharide biosynthesis protein n=2 Tax=Calycomorphotria hydatis TaxID=2528027 RepID=A0A517T4I5_9PLAN|nr:hypothetical protein V22_05120 [Calycomorphotria hydatis]